MFNELREVYDVRQILSLIFVIGIVSAGLSVGTYALLQDTDTSGSNSIQSGALNVTVDGGDTAHSKFTITNGKPGDTATYNYTLQNGGSLTANHLQINTSYIENDPTGAHQAEPSDSDLNQPLSATAAARHVEITKLTYTTSAGTTDLLGSVSDTNSNGITDLADVQNGTAFDDLTPPAASQGNSTYLEISVRIADDSGSFSGNDEDLMGDGVDVTLYFTLMQASSQDQL